MAPIRPSRAADLTDQDERVAHQDSGQRDQPDQRVDAERLLNSSKVGMTPMSPSGAVANTIVITEIDGPGR